MRILFVAMCGYIHTSRWINQLRDTGWDIHIFDVLDLPLHPDLDWITPHSDWSQSHWPFPRGKNFIRAYLPALSNLLTPAASAQLARLIHQLKPDIIHSMEMQHESYCVAEARTRLGGRLPAPWIYSSWGSDLYLYQKHRDHQARIREVMSGCDYYIPDCERDVALAQACDFTGEILGVVPTGGGYRTVMAEALRQPGAVSSRRVVAVKGYQNWAGRALIILDGIEKCADLLRDYLIVIYSAHASVVERAENLKALGLRIEIASSRGKEKQQYQFLELLGKSRLHIGVSISDGTPNTMLEAMLMGTFPIQTDANGATAEWITDGANGLIVPYDDPDAIATAIRRALLDDALVDDAASINRHLIAERLEYEIVQARVIGFYEHVVSSNIRLEAKNHG